MTMISFFNDGVAPGSRHEGSGGPRPDGSDLLGPHQGRARLRVHAAGCSLVATGGVETLVPAVIIDGEGDKEPGTCPATKAAAGR